MSVEALEFEVDFTAFLPSAFANPCTNLPGQTATPAQSCYAHVVMCLEARLFICPICASLYPFSFELLLKLAPFNRTLDLHPQKVTVNEGMHKCKTIIHA